MLDLRFVRENPEIVKQNIRNKFQDAKLPLVDEVIELDEENRKVKKEADDLRASRKRLRKLRNRLQQLPTTLLSWRRKKKISRSASRRS